MNNDIYKMNLDNKVLSFLEDNFELDKFEFEKSNLFPSGVRIIEIETGEEMLAYLDITTDKVKFVFSEEYFHCPCYFALHQSK